MKLYKNMKLGKFVPRTGINLIEEEQPEPERLDNPRPDFDLTQSGLTGEKQQQLRDLLQEFSGLFSSGEGRPGRTSVVQHAIRTTGPPIRQQMRRIPTATKDVVDQEVQRMLQHDVI